MCKISRASVPAFAPAFFLAPEQTAYVGTVRPENKDRKHNGQREKVKAIEQGVEDQQRGNQREGTQRDKTGDCDNRNAAAYGTEQRREAQGDQRADGGGHSLAAPESEKAGFDVSADDGQHTSRMEPCVGRKIQGYLNGKQALQQIAGQRENPPGQPAKSGHIGGAGIAASRRPGIDPLACSGNDDSKREGT